MMEQKTNLTCYIVDDEMHNIEYLISLIQDTDGLKLRGASVNPVEALKIVAKPHGADITFLDVEMTQMSGIDFAVIAKHFTHIVFITTMPEIPQEIFPDEPFDYLPKPISPEKFKECIKSIRRRL